MPYSAFRRQAVPGQMAQQLQALNIPVPTRGLVLSENEAFMQPGGALILDNWKPTMRGLALRGGCIRWCGLPETTPIISAFRYVSGSTHKIFAGNATKLYDVSTSSPVLVASGQLSGNYAAAQLSNAAGDWLIAVNDAGDFPLRFDGTAWLALTSDEIHGPGGSTVEHGRGLTHVCKYGNRLFFIEGGTMNAWYLGIDSISGALAQVPLAGSATKGGALLFCATWSLDTGSGLDDKLVFGTTEGELIIFSGTNPGDANNWRREGRYEAPKPMGMNAHISLGGDLLLATVEGIVPISAAITKDAAQLELAMITRNIKSMWRDEVTDKRAWSWTMHRWDEYGGMFVTWPGGKAGARLCAVVNTATGAWARFVGYDATCFVQMRGDMFFGTQDGLIMQADRTGYDDGKPYVATMVGGWELFGTSAYSIVWHQARVSFSAPRHEPFIPQITSCVDYALIVPPPPPAGVDPGVLDLWDQGLWDQAKWDQPSSSAKPTIRNTGWVSIGTTGYAHAPIIQVTVGQQARPGVEMISVSASFERIGANV